MDIQDKLPPDWYVPDVRQTTALMKELGRELLSEHRLFGRELQLVAKHRPDDDVLVCEPQADGDMIFWKVHLTWSAASTPEFPDSEEISFPNDLWTNFKANWDDEQWH